MTPHGLRKGIPGGGGFLRTSVSPPCSPGSRRRPRPILLPVNLLRQLLSKQIRNGAMVGMALPLYLGTVGLSLPHHPALLNPLSHCPSAQATKRTRKPVSRE